MKSLFRLQLSLRQCLQILAAGFFGVLHREWSWEASSYPGFSFRKLWAYDCEPVGASSDQIYLLYIHDIYIYSNYIHLNKLISIGTTRIYI